VDVLYTLDKRISRLSRMVLSLTNLCEGSWTPLQAYKRSCTNFLILFVIIKNGLWELQA
jgi:hypothetical protein